MAVFSQIWPVIWSEMKEEIKVSWFVALDLPGIRNIPILVNLSPVLRFIVCVKMFKLADQC